MCIVCTYGVAQTNTFSMRVYCIIRILTEFNKGTVTNPFQSVFDYLIFNKSYQTLYIVSVRN